MGYNLKIRTLLEVSVQEISIFSQYNQYKSVIPNVIHIRIFVKHKKTILEIFSPEMRK